jgi:signal transduction histidine kinase
MTTKPQSDEVPECMVNVEDLALCAHDLRGTLTVINGYAGTLRRHPDLTDAQREQALSGIEAAILRADAIITDTMDGRIRTGSGSAAVALDSLVLRAVADGRAACRRDIREHIEAAPSVTGDETALARVLDNLLSNAAKYAPEGPIDVTLSVDGPVAIIEVADHGPGIPHEDRKRVLEPFTRLQRDQDAPGTGLGLTVVNSVVSRFGGYVKISDRTGGGAVIQLYLPLI